MKRIKNTSILVAFIATISILFSACSDDGRLTQRQVNLGDQQIRGVIFEGHWDVVIDHDSTHNSALLEYSLSAENRVSAELRSNGYLYIKISPMRNTWHKVFRARISAASLEKIEASGACDIETRGYFNRCKDISLSGASEIEGLKCTGDNLKITLSGASRIEDFTFRGNSIDAGIAGASKIILDNADINYCKVVCSGASTFQAKGYSAETSFDGSGASNFSTLDFETDDLDIMLSGASSTKITVNNRIRGTLSGASTLKYRGRPDIRDVHTSGNSAIIGID